MECTVLTARPDHADFSVRRALERLREGLYDPLVVQLLTARHEALDTAFDAGLQRLEAAEAAHLCVCGPYGQGKSHSLTYLRQRALERGYVVSAINLDPREAPLHLFRQVYRALLDALTFPVLSEAVSAPTSLADAWQTWARTQPLESADPGLALARLLPGTMPHLFKATLVALAQTTLHVPVNQRRFKQYRDYRPTEFPTLLERVLQGESVPLTRLRPALKYRQVAFYRQASLALHGNEPFLHMLNALAQLFRRLGYQGWVLLFDEGEAITQVRAPQRARSYRLLDSLLRPAASAAGMYPVFAFTPDFFQRLQEEDYRLPYFDRDYAAAWRDLSVYHLRALPRETWQALCETLIALHGTAYHWPAERDGLLPLLTQRLTHLPLQDTRTTLKALVDELDQVQQQRFFVETSRNS